MKLLLLLWITFTSISVGMYIYVYISHLPFTNYTKFITIIFEWFKKVTYSNMKIIIIIITVTTYDLVIWGKIKNNHPWISTTWIIWKMNFPRTCFCRNKPRSIIIKMNWTRSIDINGRGTCQDEKKYINFKKRNNLVDYY